MDRVLNDNGGCYRSDVFNTACRYLGVKPQKTRPYTSRTNGKAKRFIQTSIKEWAYKWAYDSSAEREEDLQPWIDEYNYRRPHTSLKMKPPASKLNKCEQHPC